MSGDGAADGPAEGGGGVLRLIGERYELVEPLGAGGMGEVWRGYDRTLDREIAVKTIRPDVILSTGIAEEFAKRFAREARLTAQIRHHGVPQVYDAVLDPPFANLYLVMELVHGQPLGEFIDPDRPVPIGWAAAVAAQIATVLSHAHAIPVVHRDLKPENLLITGDGTVKVLDFGIAALLRPGATRLTATGTVLGSSRYMPPEQILGGQIAPQTDLYALGCVLHELLTGRPVYNAPTPYELEKLHIGGVPVPLRLLRADVPAGIETLVLDLLAKNPEHRPADAYAVYEQLLPFLPPPGAPSLSPRTGRAAGIPDPTLLYRRPNAPLDRTPAAAPDRAADRHPGPSPGPVLRVNTEFRRRIADARSRAEALAEQERYGQAVEVLDEVLVDARPTYGEDNQQVLSVRMIRAAILSVGGDLSQALPEFDALATVYTRVAGPDSDNALECRRQAAYCRAELGHTTEALHEFGEVLRAVRAKAGDVSDTALDLRQAIAALLIAADRRDEAVAALETLEQDLRQVYGPGHEETLDVVAMVERLRQTNR